MAPSETRIFETMPPLLLAGPLDTQMLVPSKATPLVPEATTKVPRRTPSAARIFEMLALDPMLTQILAPSKAISVGLNPPVGKEPRIAPSAARIFWTLLTPPEPA